MYVGTRFTPGANQRLANEVLGLVHDGPGDHEEIACTCCGDVDEPTPLGIKKALLTSEKVRAARLVPREPFDLEGPGVAQAIHRPDRASERRTKATSPIPQ